VDVVLPLTIVAIQDAQLNDQSIVNVGKLFAELCMHCPAEVLGAVTSWVLA
jgi:hypothetical protein